MKVQACSGWLIWTSQGEGMLEQTTGRFGVGHGDWIESVPCVLFRAEMQLQYNTEFHRI